MRCKKCHTETNVRDELCWSCAEDLDCLLDHFKKLWLVGEIAVDRDMRETWMDRTGNPF